VFRFFRGGLSAEGIAFFAVTTARDRPRLLETLGFLVIVTAVRADARSLSAAAASAISINSASRCFEIFISLATVAIDGNGVRITTRFFTIRS
jgi:hypothetical protein